MLFFRALLGSSHTDVIASPSRVLLIRAFAVEPRHVRSANSGLGKGLQTLSLVGTAFK